MTGCWSAPSPRPNQPKEVPNATPTDSACPVPGLPQARAGVAPLVLGVRRVPRVRVPVLCQRDPPAAPRPGPVGAAGGARAGGGVIPVAMDPRVQCDQCKRWMLAPAPFALTLDDEAGYAFCGRACLTSWLNQWYPA